MTSFLRLRLNSGAMKWLLFGVVGLGITLNAIAWMQARGMTQYLVDDVAKTQKPESLSSLEKAKVIFTGVRVPRPTNTQNPESVGLPYETHRIELDADQFSSPQHLEAWFSAAPLDNDAIGKGLVLLFPQYGSSKQSVLASGKAFREMGYDVMWVDFRGVGGSSGSDTTLGVREGEDVAAAMRYVQKEWPQKSVERSCLFSDSGSRGFCE